LNLLAGLLPSELRRLELELLRMSSVSRCETEWQSSRSVVSSLVARNPLLAHLRSDSGMLMFEPVLR